MRPLQNNKEELYTIVSDMQLMKYILLVMILMLAVPQALAINVKGGDIYLVRPNSPYIDHDYVPSEYLSVEDLVFYTCIEERGIPVTSTVICLDDNSFKDIDVVRWLDDENCYMGTYDLDSKNCRQLLIQSEYVKDDEVMTIQREIKVNRLSSVLDLVTKNQYSDGGWKDSVATASGVWVLSNYKEIYDDELALGIDWLKLSRNNDEKCWPEEDCSVRTTAKILAYLTQADLNDTYRVMHDGKVFLENNHNFYTDEDVWSLDIEPLESGTTNCLVSYMDVMNEDNFSMEQGTVTSFEIEPVAGEQLYVICDLNFRANLTADGVDQVFIYEGDNMTYNIPKNCWSNDAKWGECDLMTTLYATMTNISQDNRELALDYLRGELVRERSGEQSLEHDINLTALMAYLDDNDNVTGWLRYRQNNDGSWGNSSDMKNVITTGYALLGLLASGFNRTHEVIEDAESWVNEREIEFTLNATEDYEAWNSTEKNALAFIVLRNNARPVIKTDPMLVLIDKQDVDIEIFNPTTFDLEELSFEFSDNLKDVLTIEEEDYLPSYSYIRQTISKSGGETGNIFGYLSIYNYDYELGKVPVLITNFPRIEAVEQKDSLMVFGTSAKATVAFQKSAHTFNCLLDWDDDDISSQEEYTITGNQADIDITFSRAERMEKTYAGTFECTSGDYTFEVPINLKVSRYETFPFTVSPSEVYVNESRKDAYFIIENNLDETLDVDVKFLKTSQYFELSRNALAIDPNTQTNITIYNSVEPGMNLSAPNVIEVSALGQTREINFRTQIFAKPAKRMSPLVMWLLLFIIFAALGTGGFFAYKYRATLLSIIKKGGKIDDVKIKIKKLEEKEKNTAILNMVNILRILGKDDTQIRARLKQEGFNEEEINSAMATSDEDSTDEDSEEDQ